MRLHVIFCLCATAGASLLCAQTLSTQYFPELRELYKTASERSLTSDIMRYRAQEADAMARADRSRLWPLVQSGADFNFTVQDRQDFNYLLYQNTVTDFLTLSYPLFNWGSVKAGARRGDETVKQTKFQNKIDAREQKAQLEQLYFDLMLRHRRIAVAQQEYDAFDRQLQAAITAATASAQSLEDQKLQKAQKKLDLDRLTQDAASEKKRLAKLIGADEGLMLNFKFPGFPASLNIPEDWGKQSLPTTPTSLQYESQAREQKDFMIESRAETRPTLDFVTGFYQNQVESVDVAHQVEQTNYFVGLRLRWEIFNGFRSEASAAAARARQRRLNALAHQELSAARDSFVDDMNALKNSAADYALALERRKIASDQYDAQAALQKQGQASTDAFDAAKRAFDASEIAALEKLTDYLKLYEKIQRTLELAKNS